MPFLHIKPKLGFLINHAFIYILSVGASMSTIQASSTHIIEVQAIGGDEKVLQNALVSFYAINLNTREVVRSVNPHISLVPASSLKLLTTATALEVLGEEYTFQTTLQYDGKINTNGTLSGNIYIHGGADPALGSKMFKEYYYCPYFIEAWAKAIKGQGIKKIKGAIMGEVDGELPYYIPSTWIVGDLGWDYGVGYSKLSIFDNAYEIRLMPSQEDNGRPSIVTITPPIPEQVKIINQLEISPDSCNFVICGYPYQNTRIVKGNITLARLNNCIKGAIPDPAYWAAYTLYCELEKQGVQVEKKYATYLSPPDDEPEPDSLALHVLPKVQKAKEKNLRKNIYVTYSPPVKAIVKVINRESNNLYAEHLIHEIGYKVHNKREMGIGIQALHNFWYAVGIDTTELFMHDGSGLSRCNNVSAKCLVDILCYMKQSKNFTSFYQSFPVAGETGTLSNVFAKAPLKGNLKAKSGSMKRVISYTGYCTTIKGEDIAFSLIINNYHGTREEVLKEVEKMLVALVDAV